MYKKIQKMSTIHTMIQLFQNQAMFKLVKELKTCKKKQL